MRSKAAKEGEDLDLERASERFGCKEMGGSSITESTVGGWIPSVTVDCPLKTDPTKSSKLSLASRIGFAAYAEVKQPIPGPRPSSTIISHGTIDTN